MYCDKHIDSRAYLKETVAAMCKHMTRWKFHLYCEACANKHKICQECGRPILKTGGPSQTEKKN